MTFEEIYGGCWHHPYAFWALGAPVLGLLAIRALHPKQNAERRGFAATLIALQLLILIDAWLTAPRMSPLAGSAHARAAGIAFVILGDLRFFWLLERYGREQAHGAAAARALGYSLIVPLSSLVARNFSQHSRVLFLSYELMFVALAIGVRALVVSRLAGGARRDWIARLTWFELGQYCAWAGADALILARHDAGYLLRLAPNFAYYVGFVPFAWLTAPKELRP